MLDALNGQTRESTVDCSNPAFSSLNLIHRSIIILPSKLFQGMIWTDSTSAATCSGVVPVITISTRTHRVVGEVGYEGHPALLLERDEETLTTGEGSQNQHRISIRVEGKASGKLYIDRVSGALLDSDMEQQADVTISASRLQRFKQTVKERTTIQR